MSTPLYQCPPYICDNPTGSEAQRFKPNVHGNGYWDSATSCPLSDILMLRNHLGGVSLRLCRCT